MILILTQKDPININDLINEGLSSSDGSDLIFIGRVRDSSQNKKVLYIDYDIYSEMAVKELNKIADEAGAKHNLGRIIIIHRYGRVNAGESSILILVSSPHRDSSYAASRYIIDEIKKRVPIWKKEFYTDGSEWLSDRN
ncbi:MAG: molybdenum cofactor biosynthesis protein MoaE [Leptospirales bacterium]|nr:molybdenum cofactor biosynthesis protein MoaE [Leptospirales bacterium]